MNKQNLILINVFFSIMLVLFWGGVLFVSFLFYLTSDMFRFFHGGILIYLVAFNYVLAFVLPIILRKRLSKNMPLALKIFVFSIISVMVSGCILVSVNYYISAFTPKKWENNAKLRIYMIENLEEEHNPIGKNSEEIISLLGNPQYINDNTYEYYFGDSMIDPYGYQIEFENDIAINTQLVEH